MRENQIDNDFTNENQLLIHNDRYNWYYIIRLTTISAISGILFGYDTAVIGSALLYLNFDGNVPSPTMKGQIVSFALIGAAIGCLSGGPLSDQFGRKKTIILTDIFFIIGSFLMGNSENIFVLLLGRFISGIAIGISSMVLPVYLGESSPNSIRGSIVSANIVCVTGGQVISYFICLLCGSDWKQMLQLAVFPAFLQIILMNVVPESPLWLIKNNQKEDAKLVYKNIYNINNQQGAQEYQEKEQIIEQLCNQVDDLNLYQQYRELFYQYQLIIFIGCGIQFLQQMTGINTAMYFAPQIMVKAGIYEENNKQDNIIAAIPLAFINFIGSILSMNYQDKIGRRYILLRTLPFCAFGFALTSLGFYVNEFNHKDYGVAFIIIGLCIYIFFFAVGMGSIPWTINSEIYPNNLRGIANSLSAFSNWASNYIVSSLFLIFTQTTYQQIITFMILSVLNLITFIFVYKLLPETKGFSIEQNIKRIINFNQYQQKLSQNQFNLSKKYDTI